MLFIHPCLSIQFLFSWDASRSQKLKPRESNKITFYLYVWIQNTRKIIFKPKNWQCLLITKITTPRRCVYVYNRIWANNNVIIYLLWRQQKAFVYKTSIGLFTLGLCYKHICLCTQDMIIMLSGGSNCWENKIQVN